MERMYIKKEQRKRKIDIYITVGG